jgi:hypothetical protein
MFERGRDRGNGAAKVKCAAEMTLMTALGLAVERDSREERVRPG